jgi:ABC-type branched-subunit amino acid transport system ATPase component
MSEPVLRTDGLTKRFGGLTAVDKLSFSLAGGRLHAIIGPNGAGKTTFFNLISGLLTSDGGRVFFHGRQPLDHRLCRATLPRPVPPGRAR